METVSTSKQGIQDLLLKPPFVRLRPEGYHSGGITRDRERKFNTYRGDEPVYDIVTQADFLRELDKNAHLIYNRQYYPDIWRQDPETGKWYVEEVPRYAFGYQYDILTKQLTHLCANDIQFELLSTKESERNEQVFQAFRLGWLNKGMEIAWFEAARAVKATGDTAFVGYLRNGKFGWRVLSYEKGDKIYPHFDPETGELSCLAHEYTDVDGDGVTVTSWIEVWDDEYYYRLKRGEASKVDRLVNAIKGIYGQSGYEIVDCKRHMFRRIPVAYHRNDMGACWSLSQDSIDNYEIAFSRLAQNNHAFGTPIMYLKGEGVETIGDMNNAVKTIYIPEEGEAGFLQRQDASGSYKSELDMLEQAIYQQSKCVKNVELKSGDTPSSSIRLLFHVAIEQATLDAHEFAPFIDDMVEVFRYGYGVETESTLDFASLKMNVWIEPYVPQNVAELMQNLALGVQNKFVSKRTASMRAGVYTTNDEIERIKTEMEEEQQQDVLANLQQTMGTQIINSDVANTGGVQTGMGELAKEIDPTKVNDTPEKKERGYDGNANTGGRGRRSGRPNKSGRTYDENGNWLGRDNWEKFDRER